MTKKELFHDNWYFWKSSLDCSKEEMQSRSDDFFPINIPHDWQIYRADKLYEDSIGWYRKQFACKKQPNVEYEIYFEGIYMDSTIYLNGVEIGEWKYGYSSFFLDLTPYLKDGENELLVRVQYQNPNSRWYSGAGIYRNVYWIEKPAIHFVTDSLYVVANREQATTENDVWILDVSAELAGIEPEENKKHAKSLQLEILDEEGQALVVASKKIHTEEQLVEICVEVENPKLWSIAEPHLYQCRLSLMQGEQSIDRVCHALGFREITFDTEKGLFLNGEHIKLNGACEHHDLGALGAAYEQEAMRRKLEILKEMGVNSIRTTHNMPATGVLTLADEMGFLVVDEAFDMWERPKTTYDYARFFSDWYAKDVRSWVRRDRNHPCLLMWSIGNEIYDTHVDERGQEVTRFLAAEVEKHDPRGNAKVTIGSNFMPWENARKCADIVKFAGYNYGEKYYDEHHKEHPDWFIYGSETCSTVQSRGIYHFPYQQSVLADDDEQCSSLGNSTTSWGAKSSEMCIITERDHDFSLGQFLWSGFDYIGEPTPYHTRNSYFGQIDTAGFPKDSFYLFQSAWTDVNKKPMVHIFPYWDFNPGQLVDVRVATNAPIVELLLNGTSLGEQRIDHKKGTVLTGNWQIPYEEGELTAIAYDDKHNELTRETKHSFGNPKRLVIEQYAPEKELTEAVAFFYVSAVDEQGNIVENANNLVQVEVTGAAWLAGLDNGDSTDTEQYKGYQKRLFSGKMLVIAALHKEGEVQVKVSSAGLESAMISVMSARQATTQVPEDFSHYYADEEEVAKPRLLTEEELQQSVWIRKITLESTQGRQLSADCKELLVTAKIEPVEAAVHCKAEDLIWKAVNDAGIESTIAKVEPLAEKTEDGLFQAKVTAFGDGAFRLRCMTRNGTDKVKVISQLEFAVEGLGAAFLNPYGFIAGALYTYAEGETGNGNEHGVSTARDGRTVVGFDYVDFGSFGSDEITLPIFELGGDPCPIQIWEGLPEQTGSTLLADVVYHKPSQWNVYQEETYRLQHRVKGVKQICFVLQQKIHLKGFSFTKQEKAYETGYAAENDAIYGDSYQVQGKEVYNIGNNVTLEFTDMDFGSEGCKRITICGRTENDKNTIHVCFANEEKESRQIVEFTAAKDWKEMTFDLEPVCGKQTVRFVFLPGSKFDFGWFRFYGIKASECQERVFKHGEYIK